MPLLQDLFWLGVAAVVIALVCAAAFDRRRHDLDAHRSDWHD